MKYLIITFTLLFTLSSVSQTMSIESMQKELTKQENIFYDDTQFMMSGIGYRTTFNIEKGDKEYYQESSNYKGTPALFSGFKNVIYPYQNFKDHYFVEIFLPWEGTSHIDVYSEGIQVKMIESFFSEIITKEKIINFLKKNKINNNGIYRKLNLTEMYNFGGIDYNYDYHKYLRDNGKIPMVSPYDVWQIHFETTDNPNYANTNKVYLPGKAEDQRGQKGRGIQIFPKDLKDIPFSSVSDFPTNTRKLAEFFRKELIEYARKESGNELPGVYYESEGDKKISVGDYIGAENDFSKAIELYENDGEQYAFPEVYLKRGDVRIKLNNRIGGIEDLEKGLEYYPTNPQAYYVYVKIARAKIFVKKTYEAIFDCTKAIQLKPNLPSAYGVRGIAKVAINDISGACLDAKKATEFGNSEYEKILAPFCKRNE